MTPRHREPETADLGRDTTLTRPAVRARAQGISVVIPVKDDDAELARCLDALARQTRRPEEIIVVDNGSTDASAAVAIGAGARLIRCVEAGIPAAACRGYDQATGDVILRLDADCVPPPSWVHDVATAFAERPDTSALLGGACFIDGPRALRASLAAVYVRAYIVATAPALGHLPLFGSNLAMRRDAWLSVRSGVHRYDPDLHDDLDLAFHLGAAHRIGKLPGAPMGISMRPFRSGGAFVRRIYRGFRTVAIHWPHDFPPLRWVRLVVRDRLVAARPH